MLLKKLLENIYRINNYNREIMKNNNEKDLVTSVEGVLNQKIVAEKKGTRVMWLNEEGGMIRIYSIKKPEVRKIQNEET